MKVSTTGYKRNSKDKKHKQLYIPGDILTMLGVDDYVQATPQYPDGSLGKTTTMAPGVPRISFPGAVGVIEKKLPKAQLGVPYYANPKYQNLTNKELDALPLAEQDAIYRNEYMTRYNIGANAVDDVLGSSKDVLYSYNGNIPYKTNPDEFLPAGVAFKGEFPAVRVPSGVQYSTDYIDWDNYDPDLRDRYFRSVDKVKDWNKQWYTGRATLPQFKDVAEKRLAQLLDVDIQPYGSAEEYEKKFPESGGMYRPFMNDIVLPPFTFGDPGVINHELSHLLDYNVPQTPGGLPFPSYNSNDPVLNNIIPDEYKQPYGGLTNILNSIGNGEVIKASDKASDKEGITIPFADKSNVFSNGFLFPGKAPSEYYYKPTEIRARLNEWRFQNKIDPTKNYTEEEIQEIMDDDIKYNQKGSYDLYKLVRGRADLLKKIHDSQVSNGDKNTSDQLPQAQLGLSEQQQGGPLHRMQTEGQVPDPAINNTAPEDLEEQKPFWAKGDPEETPEEKSRLKQVWEKFDISSPEGLKKKNAWDNYNASTEQWWDALKREQQNLGRDLTDKEKEKWIQDQARGSSKVMRGFKYNRDKDQRFDFLFNPEQYYDPGSGNMGFKMNTLVIPADWTPEELKIQEAKKEFLADLNADPLQKSLGQEASFKNPNTLAAATRYARWKVLGEQPGNKLDRWFRGNRAPSLRDFYEPTTISGAADFAGLLTAGAAASGGLAAGITALPIIGEAAYAAGAANPFLQATGAALTASPTWAPGLSMANALNAGFITHGVMSAPETYRAWDNAINNGGSYQNAIGKTLFNLIDFSGLGAVEGFQPAFKYMGEGFNTAVKYPGQLYNNVATGNSRLTDLGIRAWRSPAVGLSQEASADMFNSLLNSGKMTPVERNIVLEYQHNPSAFTGRHGPIDPVKRSALNDIIGKYELQFPQNSNVIATRRFNFERGNLGANMENGRINFGDRPTSFSAGLGVEGYNGAPDRLVIPSRYLPKMKNNFITQEYSAIPKENLELIGQPSMTSREKLIDFGSGIGTTNEAVNAERELLGTGLDFNQIGKVKNDIGGFDYIVKPRSVASGTTATTEGTNVIQPKGVKPSPATNLKEAAAFSDSYDIDQTYLDKVTATDIADYKKYLGRWKYDLEGVTDDQLKRMIAANEQHLQENATGVLKGQTSTHVGGIFDKWDSSKLASQTGDEGFFGAGMYFTPDQRWGTGFTGNSQPYVISGVENPIRFNASPYLSEGYAADQPLAQDILTKLSEQSKPYHPVLGNHPEWNNLFHNADSPFDAVIQRTGFLPESFHTNKELVLQPGVDKPNFWQKSIYGKPEVFTSTGVKRQFTGPGRNLINLGLLPPALLIGAATQQEKKGGSVNKRNHKDLDNYFAQAWSKSRKTA